MGIFFTSDSHFGHGNIIKYCKRPFLSVEEMDAEMIRRWNRVVKANDIVYHLGDFTLLGTKKAAEYFLQLNGKIRILGTTWHHDKKWLPRCNIKDGNLLLPKLGRTDFISASGHHVVVLPALFLLEIAGLGDNENSQVVVLCHYPLAVWDRKHYGAWHLHGHSHGSHENDGLSLDVGVDCNQFRPVSLEDVVGKMRAHA